MRALSAVLLVAGAALAADKEKEAELKALEGTWVIDAATADGRDHTDDFAGMKLILKGNEYEIDFAENSGKGTFAIDPTKSPKWIDIKMPEKKLVLFKGKTLPGIYKFEGEKLVVCCHADGEKRPAEFDAKAKTRNLLLTYKREKK